jgi:hypothetical protein
VGSEMCIRDSLRAAGAKSAAGAENVSRYNSLQEIFSALEALDIYKMNYVKGADPSAIVTEYFNIFAEAQKFKGGKSNHDLTVIERLFTTPIPRALYKAKKAALREERDKAVADAAAAFRLTPEQEVAVSFYQGLIKAVEDREFDSLDDLEEARGLNFCDASEFKDPEKTARLLRVLAASTRSRGQLMMENAMLKKQISSLKSMSSE